MRRTIAAGITAMLALGVFSALPAQATHCSVSAPTSCPNPLVVIVVEGVGNVCNKADPVNTIAYGSKCTYGSDQVWAKTKAASIWNQAGYADGSKYQGLFWPGVGPGAFGPYRLNISGGGGPGNICVDSLGGSGCQTDTEGKLVVGKVEGSPANHEDVATYGAYCGSSQGIGVFKFIGSVAGYSDEGTLGWDQSAATILPNYGQVLKHNGLAVSPRPTIRGFNSSRGVSGSGNCGVTTPTTGFNVDGFLITY